MAASTRDQPGINLALARPGAAAGYVDRPPGAVLDPAVRQRQLSAAVRAPAPQPDQDADELTPGVRRPARSPPRTAAT